MKKYNYLQNKTIVQRKPGFFAIWVLLFPLSLMAQSPGGVSSHLKLWLRADAGTSSTTNNTGVDTWTDHNGMVLQGNNTPLYILNGANYNPAVFYNQTSYHVMPVAIPILNSTVMVAGVLVAGSSGDGYHDAWTTNDEADFPLRIKSGRLGHTGNGEQFAIYNWNRTEVSFAREHVFSNKDVAISKQGGTASTLTNAANGTGGYFYLGRDPAHPEGFGNISETIIYDTSALPAADIQKIESYTALKYGLTLDNSAGGTAGNYILSDGTTAWNASSYHRDVIGIVRDDASALLQKQSHTTDDSLRIFAGSLAAANQDNTGSIANDKSSIIIGNDGGKLQGNTTAAKPAGIYSRFDRTWKITNTNFTGNFSVEIKWDSSGPFSLSDIRLLVSGSPDFTGAAVYDGSAVTFSAGSIIISGISNAVIPINSIEYITIGSASALTPLPVVITAFSARVVNNNSVALVWQTSSETNNDYFTVQNSVDGMAWLDLLRVDKATNPAVLHDYQAIDRNPYAGISWYRLKQTDLDGQFKYSVIQTVKIDKITNGRIIVYPNPVSNQLFIKGDIAALKTVKIYNLAGQDVTGIAKTIENNHTGIVLDVSALAPGVYTIKTNTTTAKLMKQ